MRVKTLWIKTDAEIPVKTKFGITTKGKNEILIALLKGEWAGVVNGRFWGIIPLSYRMEMGIQ